MIRSQNGLPIAAYLGVLVALALASAFVAVIAIVIWLPPRPPDVMRADVVAEHFKAGYTHMASHGRTMPDRGVVWSVRAAAPRMEQASPHTHLTQMQLAGELQLRSDQVAIAAEKIARADTFVFRVSPREAIRDAQRARQVERIQRQAERAAAAAAERTRARTRIEVHADDDDDVDVDVDIDEEALEREIEQAVREVRTFDYEFPPVPEVPPIPEVHIHGPRTPEPATPPTPLDVETPEAPEAQPVPIYAPAPPGVPLIAGFVFAAQMPDGRWLVMEQGRNWAEISWITRATLIIGGTLAVLSLLAVLFARRLTRPIRNFSNAVQAVGVDPQNEPVHEEGPRELRGAARAVNTMQARLRALIADRTKTLAAVAHDMRTPLMRLRLQAENVPPEQRDKMAKEIGEVEALVASFIAFARDDPAEEARVRLDLSTLLQSIADDHAEHGRQVSFEGGERVVITGQSLGLKRLFGNLVDNALKYGATARIKLHREENAVIVDVEDDGPGVPVDQRESVFEPFVRLNEEGTRGAGLGLAAARSVARAHGGDIAILDAEKGALIRVTLPG